MTLTPGRPGPSVTLRPLRTADANVLARWGDDPEFCRAAGWGLDVPFAARVDVFAGLVLAPPRDLLRLAAVHDGSVVGYVDLRGQGDERELGFVIGERTRWDRGLGRAAAGAGCAFGFEVLGLRRVWADVLAVNQRSVRILQGLGMAEIEVDETDVDRSDRRRRFQLTSEAAHSISGVTARV